LVSSGLGIHKLACCVLRAFLSESMKFPSSLAGGLKRKGQLVSGTFAMDTSSKDLWIPSCTLQQAATSLVVRCRITHLVWLNTQGAAIFALGSVMGSRQPGCKIPDSLTVVMWHSSGCTAL